MGITSFKLNKRIDYPRLYYWYRWKASKDVICVGVVFNENERYLDDSKNHYLFGIRGGVPNSRKFNHKVKKISRAIIKNPGKLQKFTIINSKDITENCDAIVNYIMEKKE